MHCREGGGEGGADKTSNSVLTSRALLGRLGVGGGGANKTSNSVLTSSALLGRWGVQTKPLPRF